VTHPGGRLQPPVSDGENAVFRSLVRGDRPLSDRLTGVKFGLNPDVTDPRVLPFMGAGMIGLSMGGNTYLGGDIEMPFTIFLTLAGATPGVIDRWLEYIATHLPDYVVRDGPSGLGGPTSRNWFYNQYRAAALTYEVGDSTDPVLIREVAATAARGMMEVLLDELRRAGGS
jgi:hypothetical protein